MSIDESKALVRRFIEEVFNEGNTAAIADFCVPGSMLVGGLTGQVEVIKAAFPDFHVTIEDIWRKVIESSYLRPRGGQTPGL